jgi:hypothetical protein
MERALVMVVHSAIIGLLLYIVMIFGLSQPPMVAENRSVLIAAVVLIYMVVFGHGLPVQINKML